MIGSLLLCYYRCDLHFVFYQNTNFIFSFNLSFIIIIKKRKCVLRFIVYGFYNNYLHNINNIVLGLRYNNVIMIN